MSSEFTIMRLVKAINESDSYEEFALKCAADQEITALLEYMVDHFPTSSSLELYASMKNKYIDKRA